MILYVGAKYDLIFGFNRMDSGFTILLLLFVLVPLLNLSWLITEGKGMEFNFTKKKFKEWVLIPSSLCFLPSVIYALSKL